MTSATRLTISAFYFTNFAGLGLLIPYYAIYARSLGFSATQIGILLAIPPLAKATLPSLWGAAADRSGARRALLSVSTWAAAACFALFLMVESYPACLAAMLLYAVFAVPAIPFVEATTLEFVESTGTDYGRVRVFGSYGFAAAALLYGWLAPAAWPFAVIPVLVVVLVVNAVFASLIFPLPASQLTAGLHSRRVVLRRPVVLLLGAGFFMQASHGAYVGFFSLMLEDAGYPSWSVGSLWAASVAAEVVMMYVVSRLDRRLGSRLLLGISVSMAAIRWTLYATTLAPVAVGLGQMMHAFTYAGFHVAALQTIYRLFPAGNRATGMALYSGWTYGAGLMAGTALSGMINDLAGPSVMFACAAAMAVSALALILLGAGRQAQDVTS